jgi:hypothetical protein
MTTRVDVEEIESTRSEKFLAVVLLAFLLIGTIWFYVNVADWVGDDGQFSSAERKVLDARDDAYRGEERAMAALERERVDVELAKDAIDIAEAKDEPVDALAEGYEKQRAEFEAAQGRADAAGAKARATEKRATEIEEAHWGPPHGAEAWAVAGIRLAFIALWLVASLRVLSAMRRGQSRFLPLGFAGVAAGAVTALVFATDYITDYIDPFDLGPIVLSIFGAVVTVASFVGLQRWLARRIPGRRVRNGECPFCGHPARGDSPHCEGCGREVIAPCAACSQPRRVGSPHCAACGEA